LLTTVVNRIEERDLSYQIFSRTYSLISQAPETGRHQQFAASASHLVEIVVADQAGRMV
jgi:hypothetical protein